MSFKQIASVFAAVASLAATNVSAAPVTWADWTSFVVGSPAGGSAAATLGGISVRYSGEVRSNTQIDGAGTNYWSPTAPYVGPLIDNAPPNNEIIIIAGQAPGAALTTNTLTFSSPVPNLLFAIVSQGQSNVFVTYDFDAAFSIIDVDTGFWGGTTSSFTAGAGDTLTGNEAHGVIQFAGSISSLSWTASPFENWHGFTVGVAPIPEPGTWSLMLAGLALLGYISVRRSRA